MGIKVLKFGGTSVATAFAMQKVYKIVTSNDPEDKKIVVLSACAGITDKLVKLSEECLSKSPVSYKEIFDDIEKHHLKLIIDLFLDSEKSAACIKSINFILQSLNQLIEGVRILGEITPKIRAQILSFGELLSTNIFYHFCLYRGLNPYFLDSREVIYTDNYYLNAKPDLAKISLHKDRLLNILEKHNIVITQGFIGSWKKETTVLGRGGSDLSAALFGYCIDADEIQIWTDVDGVMTTDPRLVPNAKTVETITVEEISELSFFGAKVLHPDTIKPALAKNIPVRVLNTFSDNSQGTLIKDKLDKDPREAKVNSIFLIENCYYLAKKIDYTSKDAFHYYQFFKTNFEKIFDFSFNQNRVHSLAIAPKVANLEVQLSDENIEFGKVDVIAFFSPDFFQIDDETKLKLDKIANIFKDDLFNKFYYYFSKNTILLFVEEGKGKSLLSEIHSYLFD